MTGSPCSYDSRDPGSYRNGDLDPQFHINIVVARGPATGRSWQG